MFRFLVDKMLQFVDVKIIQFQFALEATRLGWETPRYQRLPPPYSTVQYSTVQYSIKGYHHHLPVIWTHWDPSQCVHRVNRAEIKHIKTFTFKTSPHSSQWQHFLSVWAEKLNKSLFNESAVSPPVWDDYWVITGNSRDEPDRLQARPALSRKSVGCSCNGK